MFFKYLEYPTVFMSGGTVYMFIEILWRGFTHWSMGICAGICFIGIYWLETHKPNMNILLKALYGSLFITANEFVTGCIVNILLGWNVWDYSKLPFSLLGQICLPFCLIWFLLCIPAFYAAKGLKTLFVKKEVEIQEV